MMRSPSSNLIPLRLIGGALGGVFLAGCFLLFMVSFPSPTIADCDGLYKTILHPRKPRHSNNLAVGEALSLHALNPFDEPSAVCDAAVVPAERELVRVLREVLAAGMDAPLTPGTIMALSSP